MSIVLLLSILAGTPVEAHRPSSADIRTPADLAAIIARLDDPQTRLAAIEQLRAFSQELPIIPNLGSSTGDPLRDEMIKTAYQALAQIATPQTVGMAIWSNNPTYQWWGLWRFPSEYDAAHPYPPRPMPAAPDALTPPWRALLPRVRQLALEGDGSVRGRAQEVLAGWPGQEEILARCLAQETELESIMRMLDHRRYGNLSVALDPYLRRMLSHADRDVRYDALVFLVSNGNPSRAPVWQIQIFEAAVDRVLELSHSTETRERAAAALALGDLRGQFATSDAVRTRLLTLADDAFPEVRWRAVNSLKKFVDRDDVQAVLRRRLTDEEPSVRRFALYALAPQATDAELHAIAAGPDAEMARFANRSLETRRTTRPPTN